MRSCASVTSGVLVLSLIAGVAAAQTSNQSRTATQGKAPAVEVIAPPTTPTDLGPRTLTPDMVACTDLPMASPPTSPLRILSSQTGDTHRVYSTNDIVVLNGGTRQGYMIGQRFFVRRWQLAIWGEPMSASNQAAIRTAGWLTVIAADERFALARVDYACDTVMADDYLEPFIEPSLPAKSAAEGATNFSSLGHVLFGIDRRQSFASGDVANIDWGRSHGIGLGTRVAFYRDRMNGTPLVEMGEGVVVEVSADSAKVVLTRARDAIFLGDYVAVRGTPTAPQD